MLAKVSDLHACDLPMTKGGSRRYWFRTPTVYDLPQMRWALTKRGIRRPQPIEFRVAGLAGIKALAALAGDVNEGNRQAEIWEDWHGLIEPHSENDIDEPDFEKRAIELARLEAKRLADQEALLAEIGAIEGNLGRHWPPYADLLADRALYDELTRIEVVRLLLVQIGEVPQQIDGDGRLSEAVYKALPTAHRAALAAFATSLLVPSEDQAKN
jgi:hypothetical protein